MAPGDSVTVHEVTPPRLRTVTVRGNVWVEGEVGHTPGMRLSEAIRLAGGPKPDVYLGRILVTRVREDSSMVQLRSAFRDSTGAVTDDDFGITGGRTQIVVLRGAGIARR